MISRKLTEVVDTSEVKEIERLKCFTKSMYLRSSSFDNVEDTKTMINVTVIIFRLRTLVSISDFDFMLTHEKARISRTHHCSHRCATDLIKELATLNRDLFSKWVIGPQREYISNTYFPKTMRFEDQEEL